MVPRWIPAVGYTPLMPSEALLRFIVQIDRDPALRERLQRLSPMNEADALQGIADTARDMGYVFDPEDARAAILGIAEPQGALSEAALATVTGGAGSALLENVLRRGVLGGGTIPDGTSTVMGKGPIPS